MENKVETGSREEEGSWKMMRSSRSKTEEMRERTIEEEDRGGRKKITQESFLSWKGANRFLFLE